MSESMPAADTDLSLWGLRPVRWGLKMLGRNAQAMAASLSPAEICEAAEFLGLELKADGADTEGSLARTFAQAAEVRRASLASIVIDPQSLLCENLRLLQRSIGLSDVDADLIMFRAMLRLHPGFEALAGKYIGLCSDFMFRRKLASLLDVPVHAVVDALDDHGTLMRSGLASAHLGSRCPLESRLRLMPTLINGLMKPATSVEDLIATLLPRKIEASLTLRQYPHLDREIRLLRNHLSAANANRSKGVNVLLHGSPGVGKTELAAALAASLGTVLYVCPGALDEETSLEPRQRLNEVVKLQRLVRIVGAGMILVDEAEDLFPVFLSDPDKVPSKAAVNECLENNPTPTLWISNRTRHIEEAFLRRFDMVIHVPPLPSTRKRDLLRESLPKGVLDERELHGYAEHRKLSPAVITRMAHVASAGGEASVRDNLRVLSGHYLRTLGEAPLMETKLALLEHDPALLNTDPPLAEVLVAFNHAQCGARLLLHGPPGTGKTALGKALSERMDKPLLRRQASSLLSCFLGETESNLREMFEEARREDGVLLLDEADSFLRDRNLARARWEVSQTNELLTQMEDFEGIFVCTTNRLDDLDPAALRRFDFKVEFKPLRHDQRIRLVRQCMGVLSMDGHDMDAQTLAAHLRNLDSLTPSDAAAALRRLRIGNEPATVEVLLAALANECRYKPMTHAPMGFVH